MNKKSIIFIIIILLLTSTAVFVGSIIFNKYILKKSFEDYYLDFANKNEKNIFTIDKITLFSNVNAKNKNASSSNFTIENLYQYTDIALFIKSPQDIKSEENTLKKVWIDNLNFNNYPELGQANLYYKNINNFAKNEFIENNLLDKSLDFEIVSSSEADLNNPILYNNLANPITLSYINSNIKTDYTITDTSIPITYDGSLLKRCNVSLDLIKSNFSFDIHIVNNLDQEFKCTMNIDIPLEESGKTIYEGNVLKRINTNLNFYRYK